MLNDWFSIGPLTVHGYGVMIAVGILAAVGMAEKLAKEYDLDYKNIDAFALFVVVLGYVGAKALYVLTNLDAFMISPASVLGSGGWVVYGGIIGGLLAALVWCKWKKWDFRKYFPILITVVPLAQAYGRIGCFMAGCCAGMKTDAWFGVSFPSDSLCWTTDPVIPTQLISAAGDFVIFAFLYWNLKHGKHREDNGAWYLILYSLGRFMIEFLRGDMIRGEVGPFSTSQFISIFIFLIGAWLIHNRQQKEEKGKEV